MSVIFIIGLDGVSTHTRRVLLSLPTAAADGVEVGHVHGGVADAPLPQHAADQAVGAAVGVVAEHDVVAGAGERADQRVLGGQARAEGVGVGAAFERRQLFLQRVTGGVGAAAVFVAVAQPADPVLGVRGGEVHGRHHGAGARLEGLAGVDGAGVEPLVFVQTWSSFRLEAR